MEKRRGVLAASILLIAFFGVFAAAGSSIDTKNILLKFSLNKGDSVTKNITISSQTGGEVNLNLEGISQGVTLEESSFVLDEGEEKNVGVLFNTKNVSEGIYIGSIRISSGSEEKDIPVIFELESKDVFFDGNLEIPAKFSDISPGEQMTVQLNVFDLLSAGGTKEGLGSSSVDVEYSVHDLHGNTIISESENFVVDNKVLVSKTITFPKDISEGKYVFSAVINYKSSVGVVTDLFTISKKQSPSPFSFGSSGESSGGYGILVFAGFVFVVLILFFVYIIKDRDRMFLELREYNSEEMIRSKSLFREQAKVARKKGKSPGKIRKEVREKIKKIKKIHEERIRELKRLNEKGKVNEMKKKLKEWKRKGYNVATLEYKLGGLSTKEMKGIMKKWKRKYSS